MISPHIRLPVINHFYTVQNYKGQYSNYDFVICAKKSSLLKLYHQKEEFFYVDCAKFFFEIRSGW